MIIVRLTGGLGNQMFQYAAGKAIARRTNLPLKPDITSFGKNKFRSYRLNHFNVQEYFATEKEIRRFRKPRHRQIIAFAVYKIFEWVFPWHEQKEIRELRSSYNPDVLKIKKSAYLTGYWQSEKYFADIADIIRHEFTVKNEPDEINRRMLAKIESVNAVSLHVRRGDYITNPKTLKFHGVLGLDYYVRALDLIVKKVKEPQIFVFSDDIPWVKENLKTSLPLTFVEHNGVEQDYEDLRLMSRCKHHIIANSSFSWWGAWLNENPQKIVIAPKQWASNETMKKRQTSDVIPDEWIKT